MDIKKYEKLDVPPIKRKKSLKQYIKKKHIIIISLILLMIIIIVLFKYINSLNNSKLKKMENNSENKNNNFLKNNITNNTIEDKSDKNISKNVESNKKRIVMKKKYVPNESIPKKIKELFDNYIEEINMKNNEFDSNNITTQFVEERLLELYSNMNAYGKIDDINKKIENAFKENISLRDNIYKILYFKKYPYHEDYIKYFNFRENPKISIIIPIYNSQKSLNIVYKSIQEQSLRDLEIIFVDDCSKDNSIKMIENFQIRDLRIILLKNKFNRGPFYSRNKGALFARGEYINFIDSDDVYLNDILEKAYLIAKNNNIDIVQYKIIKERGRYSFSEFNERTKDSIIFQPELSNQMFYGRGRLSQCNFYIYNKIIKRETYLKSLIYNGEEILNQELYMHEDALQLFSLLRVANSLFFLNKIGYGKLNVENTKSLQDNYNNPAYANKIFHNAFIEMRFFYNKTKNNNYEKAEIYEFFKMIRRYYNSLSIYITKGFELFDEVFKLFLNSEYFDSHMKGEFKNFRDKIMIRNSSNIISEN